MSSGIGLIIMLVIFAVLMILDVPIYATLLGCAIFLQVIVCGTPPTNIITGVYDYGQRANRPERLWQKTDKYCFIQF